MQAEIKQIDSLLFFEKYLESNQSEHSEIQWKVLALDFDHTLAKAGTYFGSEDWYKFLNSHLEKNELKPNSHYKWAMNLTKEIPHVSCESSKKISRLIDSYRKQGWFVVILTARPPFVMEGTLKHIEQAKLPFSKNDIIFKDSSAVKKRDCLHEWLKKQEGWEKIKDLTVLFADDTITNCENIAKLAEIVNCKVHVESFHYNGAPSTSEINHLQLKNLAVQLAAYQKKGVLPLNGEISEQEIEQVLTTLSIKELTPNLLFESMRNLAHQEGYPF